MSVSIISELDGISAASSAKTAVAKRPHPGLRTPADFPNVSVTTTGASFAVNKKHVVPTVNKRYGSRYLPAYGLYSTRSHRLLGYISVGTYQETGTGMLKGIREKSVVLFNLVGQPVAVLTPKKKNSAAWLPAHKPLVFRDKNGEEVKALSLPWELAFANQSFAIILQGDGINLQIVEVAK